VLQPECVAVCLLCVAVCFSVLHMRRKGDIFMKHVVLCLLDGVAVNYMRRNRDGNMSRVISGMVHVLQCVTVCSSV